MGWGAGGSCAHSTPRWRTCESAALLGSQTAATRQSTRETSVRKEERVGWRHAASTRWLQAAHKALYGVLRGPRDVEEPALCPRLSAAQVASDPSAAALHLTQAGVLRVDGVIDKALARALHAQCEQQLELALRHLRSGGARPTDWLAEHLLSLGPDLGKRHDCKLPLLPHVREALAQALRTLAAPIRLVVGSDAELFELSVVVSEPGCGRQPLHADFPQYADGEGAVAIVAFVATHDLRATMGPTIFLPRTHTAQFHAAFDATADDVDAREKLLAAQPAVSPVLRSGDVVLMDSALIHGGGANIVSRRALFHFSFKRPDAYPGGRFSSLLESLRGKHFLNEADDWLAEAPVDEATGMVL
ncbi:hypothetical protein AB1Y20_011596 [Prymnesium parvum]|uniref:Phytanoyl-CoA dioxygenase n=1 Tax=Prymnesium parvum TaxID=97485 RepID=A0AB34IHL0_PRYPA